MTTLTTTALPDRPERLLTVSQYLRMITSGILTKRDKVELIEGRIIEKMPIEPPHVAAMERVMELLRQACPPEWTMRSDAPLTLETSVPEPDIMVIRGPRDRYDNRHPAADDVLLVVEISDSTLRDDRTEMASLYAAARIPFYWILNLRHRRLECHWAPSGPDMLASYGRKEDIDEAGHVAIEFPERTVQISVGAMFPRKLAHPQ